MTSTVVNHNQPDRRSMFDSGINVDLWIGLLRDEVRVWKDVRPALGGLISRRTCWHRGDRGIRLYQAIVATIEAIERGEDPEPLPKRWR